MIFSRYDYRVWFWGFSNDNMRFEDNLPILWSITRKILRQNASKSLILSLGVGTFYVVFDRYSTEHIGWELNTKIHTFMTKKFFVKFTLKNNVKVIHDFYLIKFQSEIQFLYGKVIRERKVPHPWKVLKIVYFTIVKLFTTVGEWW